MTTSLDKPISRLSYATRRHRGKLRRIVVTLLPGDVIELREQGTRHRLVLSVDAAYTTAVKLEALRLRAEKMAKKKLRKS